MTAKRTQISKQRLNDLNATLGARSPSLYACAMNRERGSNFHSDIRGLNERYASDISHKSLLFWPTSILALMFVVAVSNSTYQVVVAHFEVFFVSRIINVVPSS